MKRKRRLLSHGQAKMHRDEALRKLRLLKPHFPDMNIRRLALFGSTARGDASADSDIDLLIEFDKRPVGFIKFIETQEKLSTYLKCPVDLVAFDAIRKPHHMHILDEAQDV